jgi:tryptophan synthase alpha chain
MLAKELKERVKTPVALMTYYNPIMRLGEDEFARQSAKAEVDALIVPDLPVDEADSLRRVTKEHDLDLVFLATPPTPDRRLETIARQCSGFLYLVSRYGTTGAGKDLGGGLGELVGRVKRIAGAVSPGLPVAVGFGISSVEQVREVIAAGADGAVVGSALVERVAGGEVAARLEARARSLRRGLS